MNWRTNHGALAGFRTSGAVRLISNLRLISVQSGHGLMPRQTYGSGDLTFSRTTGNPRPRARRRFRRGLPRSRQIHEFRFALVIAAIVIVGCDTAIPPGGRYEGSWGRRGVSEGRFQKPRAMAIDDDNDMYIVDMTGRIQVFSPQGEFVRSWRTPEIKNGKPSGLSFDRQGHLMVADTHYFRVLFYTKQGELLPDLTIGGVSGHGPGEFNFVTDAVQDSQGNFYVAEYGEYDRIQKFSPDGEFLMQWGSHGNQSMQFVRPQNLAIDDQDRIWVADACNHRIQVFDVQGPEAILVKMWGTEGKEPGHLSYPYDLVLDGAGHLYICEFGNHRVQKFTVDGKSLGCWGVSGRGEGELSRPWALVLDDNDRLHVLDTYNHRVQRIRL